MGLALHHSVAHALKFPPVEWDGLVLVTIASRVHRNSSMVLDGI